MLARDGRVPFEVWYLTRHSIHPSKDQEFGTTFAWDIDMLEGYPHRFLDMPADATPNSFWKCRARESLSQHLRDQKVKALWIQGWQVAAYWQAAWAARGTGAEIWLRAESNDLRPTPLWKRLIKRAMLGWFFTRIDQFLCIGTANRRLYRNYGVPESMLHDAPYAIDNERFARQADEIRNSKLEIRKGWKIPADAFCVLFCGKFIPKKRPLDIVAAAKHLLECSDQRRLHLLFVGSGELGAELRAECNVAFDAEDPGLSQVTRHSSLPTASFAGFLNQTEISRAYVAADCLVLPSDYEETWGLVVNEAMASGLPCVISDHCGCAEDLGSAEFNSTYRCGSIADLKACLEDARAFSITPQPGRASPSLDQTASVAAALYFARDRPL